VDEGGKLFKTLDFMGDGRVKIMAGSDKVWVRAGCM
jgi:hypothetical protein